MCIWEIVQSPENSHVKHKRDIKLPKCFSNSLHFFFQILHAMNLLRAAEGHQNVFNCEELISTMIYRVCQWHWRTLWSLNKIIYLQPYRWLKKIYQIWNHWVNLKGYEIETAVIIINMLYALLRLWTLSVLQYQAF